MAKKLRNSKEPFNPSGGAGFFSSTNAIDTYFETNDMPALIIPVQTKSEQFCFAWASPFSGIDTTILYCYVGRDNRWVLYLEATLRRTPYNADLEFKANGDYVDVIREGDLLLKIKRPPDKPVTHPKR
jgi:hypothetical protein